LLIVLDYQSFWPLPTYDARIPQAVADLRGRADVRAVFDLPWDNLLAAKDALWLQTAHQKPIIAGQVTRQTPVSPAKLSILQASLSPDLLSQNGADLVILHRNYDPDGRLYQQAIGRLGAPFYEDNRLALFAVRPSGEVSPPILLLAADQNDQRAWHLYAPEPGWVQLPGEDWTAPRPVTAIWGGEAFGLRQTATEAGYAMGPLLLPVSTAGFHTLTLALEPPCPITQAPQSCPTWGLVQPGLVTEAGFFTPRPPAEPIQFGQGVTLVDHFMGLDGLALWWRFEGPLPRQSIRFVKILNASGEQVAGWDDALPANPGAFSDRVDLSGVSLTPGEPYRVCVGWYTLPDVTRFPVLSDLPGAADGLACL
jgi:hypothetical protein